MPGTRKQKMQLHPGDVRFADAGDFESRDFRGDKVQKDTYGQGHLENGW